MVVSYQISNYQVADSIKLPQQRDSLSFINRSAKINTPAPKDTGQTHHQNNVTGSQIMVNQVIEKENHVSKRDSVTLSWNSSHNFFLENNLNDAVLKQPKLIHTQVFLMQDTPGNHKTFDIQSRYIQSHDWLLGIFLLLIILFIWIRLFYNKFFSMLGNALISFQIAAKLFHERNVLLKRVSIVLDFIYLMVFSIFIFELITRFSLFELKFYNFKLFLLIFNLVILYTMSRLMILKLTGFVFNNSRVFAEYQHNTFVVNKGVGIALFPVIIAVQYLPSLIISWLLVAGMVIYSGSVIMKGLRAYQIIIRKDILLFYLILYLCTLEFLPLLLGYKVMISLI